MKKIVGAVRQLPARQHSQSKWSPHTYYCHYSSNRIRTTQNKLLNMLSSKFDRSVAVNLKPISYFLVLIPLVFLSRNYWSQLHQHLMANIGEKAISILMGDSNSGLGYLITNVIPDFHIFTNFVRSQIFLTKTL